MLKVGWPPDWGVALQLPGLLTRNTQINTAVKTIARDPDTLEPSMPQRPRPSVFESGFESCYGILTMPAPTREACIIFSCFLR